ncbi:MAG TPA: large conductance mechanosensitive channel protein MscL [Candidatus Acidoferrales bacterium]|nr:large conductance mechanosensitive channel protein MscL [Candidatus Acidoferrales bacterium]
MKGFIDFLKQTNALALAVGVIIGGAVGKVVSSLVSDLLMPVISLAMPTGDWREAKVALSHKPDGSIDKALGLGNFAGNVVDFVIIAFVVYMITKALLKPAPAPPAPATKTCPECLETIPAGARKCRQCASAV